MLHEFHVPLVRARLPVAAVPGLVNMRDVFHALEVGPEDTFEFDGLIGIPVPLSAHDQAFLESVGVKVITIPR